jgi:FkbH-like protein
VYEAEVNRIVESIATLPEDVRERFAESRQSLRARTILPWGEHCTECNWPTCYTTCGLYTPRMDGGCRLFMDGTVRLNLAAALNGYVTKIRFKQWAKLWTVGTIRLIPLSAAARRERLNLVSGAAVRSLPLSHGMKARVLQKVSYIRRRSAEEGKSSGELPDSFLFECYNPGNRPIDLTFTVRRRGETAPTSFQTLLHAPLGFIRARVPVREISNSLDLRLPFEVEIVPNECDGAVLYFGALDFVKERAARTSPSPGAEAGKTWKCIVWDLDNTLWDGTLIEDGPAAIRVRLPVVEAIRETDRRGILHSIASKNDTEEVMRVLRVHGIEDLFLYPQIGWQPKSKSISAILQSLNIGADSIAFVDDQPFEREEVSSVLPEVAVIDAREAAAIPDRSECHVPVTEESRQRRLTYRQQQQRESTMQSYQGDYREFLRECDIRLTISALTDGNLERVHELAQRTNQMNFSGNRYPPGQLREILASGSSDTYVLRCWDRFGNYGIVGFSVVQKDQPRLLDLMFSCRIQGKRVEHAFLAFLLHHYRDGRGQDFFANYRKTPKNAPSGRVFEEVGFEIVSETEGVTSMVFKSGQEIPDDGIITVVEEDAG